MVPAGTNREVPGTRPNANFPYRTNLLRSRSSTLREEGEGSILPPLSGATYRTTTVYSVEIVAVTVRNEVDLSPVKLTVDTLSARTITQSGLPHEVSRWLNVVKPKVSKSQKTGHKPYPASSVVHFPVINPSVTDFSMGLAT